MWFIFWMWFICKYIWIYFPRAIEPLQMKHSFLFSWPYKQICDFSFSFQSYSTYLFCFLLYLSCWVMSRSVFLNLDKVESWSPPLLKLQGLRNIALGNEFKMMSTNIDMFCCSSWLAIYVCNLYVDINSHHTLILTECFFWKI